MISAFGFGRPNVAATAPKAKDEADQQGRVVGHAWPRDGSFAAEGVNHEPGNEIAKAYGEQERALVGGNGIRV